MFLDPFWHAAAAVAEAVAAAVEAAAVYTLIYGRTPSAARQK